MFYRYGYRIFNLKHVQEIYIRDSLFGNKYILGFFFTTPSGNLFGFGNNFEKLVFDDEHTIMEEYNKICKMLERKDKINSE